VARAPRPSRQLPQQPDHPITAEPRLCTTLAHLHHGLGDKTTAGLGCLVHLTGHEMYCSRCSIAGSLLQCVGCRHFVSPRSKMESGQIFLPRWVHSAVVISLVISRSALLPRRALTLVSQSSRSCNYSENQPGRPVASARQLGRAHLYIEIPSAPYLLGSLHKHTVIAAATSSLELLICHIPET
jgi:hypothetical protein